MTGCAEGGVCPLSDFLFLGEQDNLSLRCNLQQEVQERTGPLAVGVDGYVVQHQWAGVVSPGHMVSQRDSQEKVSLL